MRPLRLVAAAALAVALAAGGPSLRRWGPVAVDAASTELANAGLQARTRADIEGRAELAVRAAIGLLEDASDVDLSDPALLRAAVRHAVQVGHVEGGVALLAVWQPASDDVKGQWAGVELALQAGDWANARQLAWERAVAYKPMRRRFMSMYLEAHRRDPDMWAAEPYTVQAGVDADQLERLGGGSTITIKFRLNDETVGAFKPNQTRMQSNYRAELAAYRLCSVMRCGFDVPRNREVRIREQDFLDLYGLNSIDSGAGYSAGFVDLVWFEDESGERWLHGTLKDWVPGFTRFPIESVGAWDFLVSQWMSRERLDAMDPLRALDGFRGEDGNYGGLASRREEMTALDLSRQLSNLHVFDFLLNNWDRYSGEFPGVNCQFNHGRFVSIDNGAAFQPPGIGGGSSSSTTWARMQPVGIFSRETIDALTWVDPAELYTLLFPPSPHHDEMASYKPFLLRRQRLLEHVHGQVQRRGEADVFMLP